MVEHDRLVGRIRRQAIKKASPEDRAYSADVTSGRHCRVAFRKALVDYGATLSRTAEVLLPTDKDAYDAARYYNLARNDVYDNRPAAIVYLGIEADAVVVTNMADVAGCRVCGRSGGHDSAGSSVCIKGVFVDVSRLTDVEIDAGLGVARIQAGVRFGQLRKLLGTQGLGAVMGACPTVSIAGFTLGGGWGALSKLHGLGCDNVLSYTVVIPGVPGSDTWGGSRHKAHQRRKWALESAQLVVANTTGPYSDLFFALRGAGHSSFGIMTSLTYRVFPLPTVAISQVWFPNIPANREIVAQALYLWQQEFLNQPPLELSVFPYMVENPASGTFDLALPALYASSEPNAEAALVSALQPFMNLGGELAWAETIPYEENAQYLGNLGARPEWVNSTEPYTYWEYKMGRYVERSLTLNEFQSIVDGVVSLPVLSNSNSKGANATFYRLAYLEAHEGAITTPAPTDMAFVHRSVGFDLAVDVLAPPGVPGALTAAADWLRALFEKRWTGIVGSQAYQNYPSVFYQPRRVALDRYYGQNLCRLVGIKAKFDPRQVFGWVDEDKTGSNGSGNQGIPPSLPGC